MLIDMDSLKTFEGMIALCTYFEWNMVQPNGLNL